QNSLAHEMPSDTYLNSSYAVKSWFLTGDHKRIAVMYVVSISLMFLLGGVFATLVRLELLTPAGDLFQSDTYNKLFTMHGVVMIFGFLVPSIPVTLGNFLIPIMIGARDLAFPKINLASWYLFMAGGTLALSAIILGGLDTGWTFYTPYSSTFAKTHVVLAISGIFLAGF